MCVNQGKEAVGTVTEEEKKEVLCLHERIMGLQELLPVLQQSGTNGDADKDLYERVVRDLGSTKMKQDEWWNRMSEKYKWKGMVDAYWEIDFEDNSIYLQVKLQ